MNYLGWTTENCHFVVEILALPQNRLFLMLSGFEMEKHLSMFSEIFQKLFLWDLQILKHMWPVQIEIWMCSFIIPHLSSVLYSPHTHGWRLHPEFASFTRDTNPRGERSWWPTLGPQMLWSPSQESPYSNWLHTPNRCAFFKCSRKYSIEATVDHL